LTVTRAGRQYITWPLGSALRRSVWNTGISYRFLLVRSWPSPTGPALYDPRLSGVKENRSIPGEEGGSAVRRTAFACRHPWLLPTGAQDHRCLPIRKCRAGPAFIVVPHPPATNRSGGRRCWLDGIHEPEAVDAFAATSAFLRSLSHAVVRSGHDARSWNAF